MEDPNEEEWRIQEFCPTEANESRLRRLWHSGFSLGKKIALTGIVASAAPLALPPLVVLSAFGIAFTVPFGFYFASYAITDKLMSTLLSKPKPPPPPLLLRYEYVFGDDEYEYNIEKAEEDGYEEDDDIEEGEKVEDDTCKAFEVSVELDEENSGIRDDSGLAVGIVDILKHMGEVIDGEFEQDGYEEDGGEYMEKEEPIPGVASEILRGIREAEEEISSMEEERGDALGNDGEAVVVSAEVGDIKQADVSRAMKRKFDDAELGESEKESVGILEEFSNTDSLEQLKLPSEKGTVEYTEKKEPVPNVALLKGVGDADEEISADDVEVVVVSVEVGGENDIDVERVEEVDIFGPRVSMEDSRPKSEFDDVEGEMLGNGVEAVVESAELSVGNDINVELVEEVDVFGAKVRMDDTGPKVKFGDVGPEELEGEPKGMVESYSAEDISEMSALKSQQSDSWSVEKNSGDVELGVLEKDDVGILEQFSNERKDENANLHHAVEKTSPFLHVSGEEFGNNLEEFVVANAALQEFSEPVSTKEDIQDAGNNAMFFIPEEIEKMRDIENVTHPTREDKHWEDIGSEKLTEGTNGAIGPKGDEGEAIAVEMERLQNDNGPVEGNFGDVEPGVLEKEDVGILEPFSNELKDENANLQHAVEKTSPSLHASGEEFSNTNNLEQLKFPSGEEIVVTNAALPEFSEPVSTSQDTRKDDKEVSTKEDIQDNLEGIRSEKLAEGTSCAIGPKGDKGEATAVDKDLVRVKKLVVHVKKPGDNTTTSIREETVLKTTGKTLICMRANTNETVTETALNLLRHDNEVHARNSQSAGDHPEGIDANLHDHGLPSFFGASTSKTTEGLNNEESIWKQINAMRTIVGYEATPHSSCVEELKALYVFTGVEPPASFSEPSSMADVNEMLQFLMAIVGVKV